jgi:hypothetical protein
MMNQRRMKWNNARVWQASEENKTIQIQQGRTNEAWNETMQTGVHYHSYIELFVVFHWFIIAEHGS